MPLKLAVFRTGHLGDTVCAIPAFRLLRHRFDSSEISLICDEPCAGEVSVRSVIERLGIFDRIMTYQSRRGWRTVWDLFWKVRSIRPDVLVHLPQLHKSCSELTRQACFFRLAGVRCLLGFRPNDNADGWHPNEALRLTGLLNAEGVSGEKPDYAIPFDERAWESACWKMRDLGLRPGGPYVVFCGGGKTPTQRWPFDRYAAVLERLISDTGVQIIGVGGQADIKAYESTILPGAPAVRILSPPPTLAELTEVLRAATAYIGNDTGPMHLAAAVGCPVIALMSARNKPGQWDPDAEQVLVFRNRTECEGCWLDECAMGDHRCMTGIKVDWVLKGAVPFVRSLVQDGICSIREPAGGS